MHIGSDLRFQCVYISKALLIAQSCNEVYSNTFIIEVWLNIEQMYFYNALLLVEGWTNPDIDYTVIDARSIGSVTKRAICTYAYGIDAVGR